MHTTVAKRLRAFALVLAFSITLVPAAAAAPRRDREAPSLIDEVVRIVRIIRKAVGSPASNADSLTTPRP